MLPLQEFAEALAFGEATEFENLTMVPVMGGTERAEPGYLLLKEAMEAKLARVTEVGGGVVPELLFENLADQPVLTLEGEELVGAKQNRVVNLTILAAPRSKIVIPVSCVEAGRWHLVSKEFAPSNQMAFARVRQVCSRAVTLSMQLQRSRRSDQIKVWDVIAERSSDLGASSGTGAMRAIFDQRQTEVEEFVRALPWREGQAGAAFLIDGMPRGLDVFDHSRTAAKTMAKLVRGYAVDALAEQRTRMARKEAGEPERTAGPDGRNPKDKLRDWLAALGQGETLVAPAVGMGQDVRLANEKLAVAALWAEERFVHFCAFSTDGTGQRWQRTRPNRRDLQLQRPLPLPRPRASGLRMWIRPDPDEKS